MMVLFDWLFPGRENGIHSSPFPLYIRGMKTRAFTKAEGAQNDFVVVLDWNREIPVEERKAFTRLICHRRKSVGADGTIFIESHEDLHFTMCFYNPDGSDGAMCGNGGRCAALYAHRHQLAPPDMEFETAGRKYRAEILGDLIRLHFPEPLRMDLHLPLPLASGVMPVHYIHNGAPHAVVFRQDLLTVGITGTLDELDIMQLGRTIRNAPIFQPEGVNANFVARREGGFAIRTYERGVECETESCGTGATATALALHLVLGVAPPISLSTHGGDILRVGFHPHPEAPITGQGKVSPTHFATGLWLEGGARLVFDGQVEV